MVELVASSDGLLRKGMLNPRSPNSRFRMMRRYWRGNAADEQGDTLRENIELYDKIVEPY